MRITVTLPDPIADHYVTMAHAQGRPIEEVAAAQLTRFKTLVPGQKAIVFAPSQLPTLEARTGGLPIRDGADLVSRVERLARITFENIEIPLTLSQREELAHRASRQGKTVDQLVQEIWRDLEGNFFYTKGGGEASAQVAADALASRRKSA